MEDQRIIALIEGYQAGTLSEEDTIEFFRWYSEAGIEEFHRVYAHLPQQNIPAMPEDFKSRLEQDILDYEQQPRTISIFRRYRWASAAAILLMIGVGGYLMYQNRQPGKTAIVQPAGGDVAPGTTKAVLTLADGRQITIDTISAGILAMQGKTKVQHDGGAIAYEQVTQKGTLSVLYNTLTTGRGEQSPPLVLSDGTKVWLNALSSIRFPVSFSGNTRDVEITGEAYFEVAKNTKMPFHVKVKEMEVEVLGTHFNVNSYTDEPAIKTTLLEGSVRIVNKESVVLKPGQEALVTSQIQPIIVQAANVDQAVAWKNGLFDFNHASLQTVLRQLSRWYDIEVKFEGNIPERTFRGKITRDLNLSQVTQLLQDVRIKFRIEGKTLIVTK
jgi:transmembrane sensor